MTEDVERWKTMCDGYANCLMDMARLNARIEMECERQRERAKLMEAKYRYERTISDRLSDRFGEMKVELEMMKRKRR